MAVFVISDTHFGHKGIIKFRDQFETAEEHDDTILDNILSVAGKRDSLYILGDVCVDASGWHNVLQIASRVEHLHIVLGNHDQERKTAPTLAQYMSVCKTVSGLRKYKEMWLSHAPLHPAELRGKVNVHGHVHSNSLKDDRYFNVSCENVFYHPVNMETIREAYVGS